LLAIGCWFLRDTYEAERTDAPGKAEWPPSWMRMFSALVSVARPASEEDGLLRALETAPHPEIRASSPREVLCARRTAFVPTNKVLPPHHSTLPARTNDERAWARAAPRRRMVIFVWPALDLSDEQRALLGELCKRVPYLGRTTCPALVEVVEHERLEDLGWALVPRRERGDGSRFVTVDAMRVPFAGALAELRGAHEAKYARGEPRDAWQIGNWIEYGYVEAVREKPSVDVGPLGEMVVMAIERRVLDGRFAARVTSELRRALRSRADRDIAAIHGHHQGSQPQCAFVALPFVGAKHADGHLLGVAVTLPRNLDRSDAVVIANALPPPGGWMELKCGALGILRLRRLAPLDLARSSWGLQRSRWAGPAERWVTAYPIVFDRYFKRHDDPEEELRHTVERSGYPKPLDVITSRHPMLPGAVDLAPRETIRRPADPGVKPYRHAVLRFPRPLQGPVVIGSMRHYGLGLCAPLDIPPSRAAYAATHA
jgi:CRISPR-associated protein Csb2